ncbi:TPA: DUF4354 family protein [Proteus mirabilis]|uniref:DUF4354 family protein n=1 Tax=Proteus mirabilis TaxID=584 RepID=UPI0023F835AF|nr:DUF4354 family protein [Proteus mirabilis]MDF7387320.1 DUF4354 family protein [Proteus mirabilis]MDF7448717.1 DUF4354 family protein [Proteus mirabilis]HEK0777720.1 DUF4354 family protein [Proteus mirabilis]
MFKYLSLSLFIVCLPALAIPELTQNELEIYAYKNVNFTSTLKGNPFYVTKFDVEIYAPSEYKGKGIAWLKDGCFVAVSDDGQKFYGGKMDINMIMHIAQKDSYAKGKIEFKNKNNKVYDANFIDWVPEKCPE